MDSPDFSPIRWPVTPLGSRGERVSERAGPRPHFSSDGRLIFLGSERDGFRCVGQKVGPDMHPDGKPFPPHAIVFARNELAANIWLIELAKKDAH